MKDLQALNEKIAATKEEIRQNENHVKRLIQEQKAERRKMRTRRLIERGAILESMIDGAESFSNEEIKELLETVFQPEMVQEMLGTMQKLKATGPAGGRETLPDTEM